LWHRARAAANGFVGALRYLPVWRGTRVLEPA